MGFDNYSIDTINDILPEEFYKLIDDNKDHIKKTFPVTLLHCVDLKSTGTFITNNLIKENKKEGYFFYIRDIEKLNLVGYVCIKNINKSIAKCEFAYFIDKQFEGKGIISKAVGKVIEFCFSELMMNKIIICTSKINTASQSIALKYGFQDEGILREEFRSGEGVLEDIIYFGLLKKDYNK
ncbi:MAG TPA: GNAT family protein [Flavobacterium sp.]|nr:GNAT family protein [Flavobacterium sp.]